MRVDGKVDERQNIVSATQGAAKYLQKNNFYFNNWIYALQAYQMGAGGAMEVLGDKGSGATHMTIDKKTYWYVKKFIAHKVAFEAYLNKPGENVVALAEYTEGAGKSLKQIADINNIDHTELQAYNSWLLTKHVPTDKAYTVIIPNGKIIVESEPRIVSASAGQITETDRIHDPYLVTPFDPTSEPVRMISLNGIPAAISRVDMSIDDFSKEVGVESTEIIEYNDLLPHGRIIPGQVYYRRPKRNKAQIYYHTVEVNESAWSISQRFGVKKEKLLKMNRIEEKDPTLATGRVLWMKKTRPAGVPIEIHASEQTGE